MNLENLGMDTPEDQTTNDDQLDCDAEEATDTANANDAGNGAEDQQGNKKSKFANPFPNMTPATNKDCLECSKSTKN
ncbi:hypothetical protein BGZ98_001005, partial [Dissophora globulifera]